MTEGAPSLYEYTNYRKFLNDWMAFKKASGRFSLRGFARRADFKAHNVFQLVLQGKRNLTVESARKFSLALGLNQQESRYFEDIVLMNQSDDERERIKLMKKVVAHPKRRLVHPLEHAQLAIFAHWAGPVVFELISFKDFRPDAQWVVEKVGDRLTIDEAQRLLDWLHEADLIEEDSPGNYRQKAPNLDSGDNIASAILYAYHEKALIQAVDALFVVPADRRAFQVLTTAVPQSLIPRICELAARFEEDVWSLVENDMAEKDEVVQISLQVIPTLAVDEK